MGMRKLRGQYKADIWEYDVKDEEKGVKGRAAASIAFDTFKPQCDRCTNPNKRVVIQLSGPQGGKKFKMCMDCLIDLVKGVNVAMQEFKLVRLVLTGMPIGDAIEEVLGGDETNAAGAAELQAALDHMVDMMYAITGDTEIKKNRRAQEVDAAFDNIIDELGCDGQT